MRQRLTENRRALYTALVERRGVSARRACLLCYTLNITRHPVIGKRYSLRQDYSGEYELALCTSPMLMGTASYPWTRSSAKLSRANITSTC
jgi:hypothetical protein